MVWARVPEKKTPPRMKAIPIRNVKVLLRTLTPKGQYRYELA
jgi:hypothetical protein